eukprot:g2158.t1
MTPINKGEKRVGVIGWISGRKAVMWQKPACFLKGMGFGVSKSSRGKCKMSGEPFAKGENQLVLNVHNTDVRVKLNYATSVLRQVATFLPKSVSTSDFDGYESLSKEERAVFEDALVAVAASGDGAPVTAGVEAKKRRVAADDVQNVTVSATAKSDTTRAAKKARKTSTVSSDTKSGKSSKPQPVTKREKLVRRVTSSDAWSFKIISWNVDGIRAAGRLEGLERIVKEHDPDLLVLQETKLQPVHAKEDRFTKLLKERYDSFWYCSTKKKGYSGTAAFTRRSAARDAVVKGKGSGTIVSSNTSESNLFQAFRNGGGGGESSSPSVDRVHRVRFGTGQAEADAEGRSISVEYDDFIVLVLYVPNSGQGLKRLDFRTKVWDGHLREFVADLEKSSGKPVIVTGDLNVAHRNVDVYNWYAKHLKKQPGCTDEERESFTEWLEKYDRADALRALHGDAQGQYTYWSSRAGNRIDNRGLRLDYFVVPSSLMGDSAVVKVSDCWAIDEGFGGANTAASRTPSDHCPVACVLSKRT